MKIAKTGQLNERIQIVKVDKNSVDEFGDPIPTEEIIYPNLFAYQKTLIANEVSSNLETLKNQSQFVIRHRNPQEPLITTDMHLIHQTSRGAVEYKILDFNEDPAFKEWDVIICERIGQVE